MIVMEVRNIIFLVGCVRSGFTDNSNSLCGVFAHWQGEPGRGSYVDSDVDQRKLERVR